MFLHVGQGRPDEVLREKSCSDRRTTEGTERHGKNPVDFRVLPFLPWLNPNRLTPSGYGSVHENEFIQVKQQSAQIVHSEFIFVFQ